MAERADPCRLPGRLIGKPYIILLNCADPDSEDSRRLAAELTESYGHAVFPPELHLDDCGNT